MVNILFFEKGGYDDRFFSNKEAPTGRTRTVRLNIKGMITSKMSAKELGLNNVYTGEELRSLTSFIMREEKRSCFSELRGYLNNRNTDKVFAFCGLRRTGKTTMMAQAISEMDEDDFKKTAMIIIKDGDTYDNLRACLDKLVKRGYAAFFIDEITMLDGFIKNSSELANIFTFSGKKVVLAGTDSLSFALAGTDNLYGRVKLVNTSNISFAEFARLTKIDDVDTYIEFGGALIRESFDGNPDLRDSPFATIRANNEYMNTAISNNILHSLERGGAFLKDGYSNLKKLYDAGILRNVINRVVAYINEKPLTESFTNVSLGYLPNAGDYYEPLRIETFGSDSDVNISRHIDTLPEPMKKIVEKYFYSLGIDRSVEKYVTQEHLKEIEKYLTAIGLTSNIKQLNYELDYRTSDHDGQYVSTNNKIVINQPGMRYCIAKALVDAVREDSIGYMDAVNRSRKLDTKNATLLKPSKLYNIINGTLSTLKGKILEDVVLTEAQNAVCKLQERYPLLWYNIFKLEINILNINDKNEEIYSYKKEIDMVAYDGRVGEYRLFEVKHAKNSRENFQKHLEDKSMEEFAAQNGGQIVERAVLYNGQSKAFVRPDGYEIYYYNASDFLKQIDNNPAFLFSNRKLDILLGKINPNDDDPLTTQERYSRNEPEDYEEYEEEQDGDGSDFIGGK